MTPVQGELEVGGERVPYELSERDGQFCMTLGSWTDSLEPGDIVSGPQLGAFCGSKPNDEFPVVWGASGGRLQPAGRSRVGYVGSVFAVALPDVSGLRLRAGDREVEPELSHAPGGAFQVFAFLVEGQGREDELPDTEIISVDRLGS